MKAKTLAAVLITLFYGISFGAVKIKGKATYITGLEKDVSNVINTSGDDKFYLMGSQMNVDLDVKAELVKDVWAKVKLVINPYSSVPANDWKTVYLNDFMAYFHKDNITLIPFYKAKVVSFGDPAGSVRKYATVGVNTISTNLGDWKMLPLPHRPVAFDLFDAVVGPVSVSDGDISHMSRAGDVMGGAYIVYDSDWVQAEAFAMQDVLIAQNDFLGLRVGSGVDMDMFQIYFGAVMLQNRYKTSTSYFDPFGRLEQSGVFWSIRQTGLPDKHSEFGGYVKFVMPGLVSVAAEAKLANDTGVVGNPTNAEKVKGMEVFAAVGTDMFEDMGTLAEVDFLMRNGTDETNRDLSAMNIVGKVRGDYDLDAFIVRLGVMGSYYTTQFLNLSGGRWSMGYETVNLKTGGWNNASPAVKEKGMGGVVGLLFDFTPMELPFFNGAKIESGIMMVSLGTVPEVKFNHIDTRFTLMWDIEGVKVESGVGLLMFKSDAESIDSTFHNLDSGKNTFVVPMLSARYDFAKEAYMRFSFGYVDDPSYYCAEHGFGLDYQVFKDTTKVGVDENNDGTKDYYILKSPYYLAHALRFGFETTVKF